MKIELVDNWLAVMTRSYSALFAWVGALLPDVLQLIADHSSLLPSLTDGHKNVIRLACLIAIVALRPIKQPRLTQ